MSWRQVVELYNSHWHPFEGEPQIRSESGLQSRYYRILDFPVKIRKKKEPSRPDLGLIPSTGRRYSWMGAVKDQKSLDDESEDEDEDENDLGSKMEVVDLGPDRSENAEPESRAAHRSDTEAASVCSRVILHTSETDSEVEPEQGWKKLRSSNSHGRFELKVQISVYLIVHYCRMLM